MLWLLNTEQLTAIYYGSINWIEHTACQALNKSTIECDDNGNWKVLLSPHFTRKVRFEYQLNAFVALEHTTSNNEAQ